MFNTERIRDTMEELCRCCLELRFNKDSPPLRMLGCRAFESFIIFAPLVSTSLMKSVMSFALSKGISDFSVNLPSS